ncbi:Oxysterol-binding protein 3 [Dipsacomyces acuminosporus]|nr:Oxysterol-binding protein 3 [Dipsacomyces acuminosporus]
MEELEILPRDAYLHTLNITQVPCTIQWWFSTKRKNIDFGLFQRKRVVSSVGGDDASFLSHTPGSIGTAAGATVRAKMPGDAGGFSQHPADSDMRLGTLAKSQSEINAKQRGGYFRLHDKNVVELMPLKHYESSRSTIKGTWNAVEPGAYILYFDNSFSKNTSKRLSFCVAVKQTKGDASDKPPVAISGWLLKKKRKRMQGWASRWFFIQGRWLSYSTTEGGIVRAKIDIVNAVVSMSKDDRTIIVDGDEGFMQLRAESDDDFKAWVSALQSIKDKATALANGGDVDDGEGVTFAPGLADADLHGPDSIGMAQKSQAGAREPSPDFQHLERAHASFEDTANQLTALLHNHDSAGGSSFKEQVLLYLELLKTNEGALYHYISTQEPRNRSALSRKNTQSSTKPIPLSHTDTRVSWLSSSGSDIFYDTNEVLELSQNDTREPSAAIQEEPFSTQHPPVARTSSSVSPNPENSSSTNHSISHASARGDLDSLSDSEAEDTFNDNDIPELRSPRDGRMHRDLIRDPDFMEALAMHRIESPRPSTSVRNELPTQETRTADRDTKLADLDNQPSITLDTASLQIAGFEPRTSLPAVMCEANVSLISILRKNVGKDLSSIAMPLVMNEPINALQALCEELFYSQLLQKADSMDDSLDRLMYVAAFAISTLSMKKHRAERKPFNPLLGETYELVDPHLGFRFISEKVSHHPPVMACYADSPFYRFWQDSSGKSKFWGKSMEMIQTSNVHIELLKHGDHFTYGKPSALVRGLITGNRSVDFTGEMNIINQTTGDRCAVHFKEGGMFSSSNDLVECYLYRGGESSKVERVLRGSWPSQLRYEKSTTQSDVIWTAMALPPNSREYYSFSYFTMCLNEVVPQTIGDLPPTDTRFRPDQRAYEEGRLEDAEAIKYRLEEDQRERKRDRDAEGIEWKTQWFEERADPYSPTGTSWQYKGGYWDARANKEYPPSVNLWGSSIP